MPRTVVYDKPLEQAHQREILAEDNQTKPTKATRAKAKKRVVEKQAPQASTEEVAELPTTDSYLSKIAKYVPAETIAIMLAFFAAFTVKGNGIWLILGLGAAANVIYLLSVAMDQPVTQRPRAYFYVLSVLAFLGWAIAVVEVVQDKFGIDTEAKQAFVLGATAFLVPALDSILSKANVSFK